MKKSPLLSSDITNKIVEYSHEAIVITDDNYIYSYVNSEACKLFGYSREEMVGLDFRKTISEESLDLVIDRNRRRLRGEDVPHLYEFWLLRKNGEKRLVEVSSVVIEDFEGKKYTVGQLLDITSRRRDEEALKESEQRYRLLAENASDVIWLVDIKTQTMSYITPSVEILLGYSVEEIIKLVLSDFLTKKSFKLAISVFFNVEKYTSVNGIESQNIELEFIRKDGSQVWTESRLSIIYDQDQNPITILGISRNIQERKKAEEAMKKSEEKYRILIETSPEIILKQNMESKITFVNKTFLDILGYTMEESLEMIGRDLVHPKDRELVRKSTLKILDGKNINDLQCRFKKKNGGYIWILVNASPIFDAEGDVIEVLAVAQDITERKIAEDKQVRAEKALEESESRYRNIISSMTDGIIVTDVENRITIVNRAVEIMIGYSSVELIDKSIVEFIDPKSRAIFSEKTQERHSGEVLADEYELTFIKKTGEKIVTRVGASAVIRDNIIEGSFAVITDITVQQELEERRSNFISMTTHELRTPLTIIKGYVDLFDKFVRKDSNDNVGKYQKPLQQINKNIYRLEKLISDVNNISKIEAGIFQLETDKIDFHNLLLEVVSSYRLILKDQFQSNIDENHSPVLISGDSARLFQVLSNLIENAIQNTPVDDRKIIVNQYLESDKIFVKIIDNGAGIEPKFKRLIFEPFVSVPTEFHVKGTGVGLYLAKYVVEAHGGILNVTSEGKGKGSVFSVSLPIQKIQETNNK